jgi:hypothetical protein
MPKVFALYAALFLLTSTLAAFTHTDYWLGSYIRQNPTGTWCFYPGSTGLPPTKCQDEFLSALLQHHLESTVGHSIAYYNDKGIYLGVAILDLKPPLLHLVFVCMSGQLIDSPDEFRTMCRTVIGNDDMPQTKGYERECTVPRAPRIVHDGCYKPPINTSGPNSYTKSDKKHFWEIPWVEGTIWVLAAIVTVATPIVWVTGACNPCCGRRPFRNRTFRQRRLNLSQDLLPLAPVRTTMIQCVLPLFPGQPRIDRTLGLPLGYTAAHSPASACAYLRARSPVR